MRLSLKWLQEYIPEAKDTSKIAEILTDLGIEVERVEEVNPTIVGVKVAKIEKIEKHPNADKLKLCSVYDGSKSYEVVCGAENINEGDIVPLALHGARLPSGVLKRAKIRGVLSEGMMCSEVELGVGPDKSGIMILNEETKEIGENFIDIFDLKDVIFEISITPNRGDLLSVKGIVRELCPFFNKNFDEIEFTRKNAWVFEKDDRTNVEIKNYDLCPCYGYGVVKGVIVKLSPFWLRYRLYLCGIRPINNVVDITNYILLELGHPMHAFDLDKIKGDKIIVRMSKKGEKIKTLDGVERQLDGTHLVIADSEKPIAIAGIMGGANTEVDENTKNILFECAFFNPQTIRRSSKKLALSSDSSYQFERGVDSSDIEDAILKAYQMLGNLHADKNLKYSMIKIKQGKLEESYVIIRYKKCYDILDINIPKSKIIKILKSLGFILIESRDEYSKWIIPRHRIFDIQREIDVIEEIARVYGYKKIDERKEIIELSYKEKDVISEFEENLTDYLVANGFYEVVTYCFIDKKESEAFAKSNENVLELRNPIAEDMKYLRTTLCPSLIKVARTNLNYGYNDLKMFELAKVYCREYEDIIEEKNLAILIAGEKETNNPFEKKRKYDFYDIKGIIEGMIDIKNVNFGFKECNVSYMDKNESLFLTFDNNILGYFGKINNDIVRKIYDIKIDNIYFAELFIDKINAINEPQKRYRQFARYPAVFYDLSFLIDGNVSYEMIVSGVRNLNIKELEKITIYDIFKGKNIPKDKISVTYRFVFRSKEKTLTGEEVKKRIDKIVDMLTKRYNIQLRTQ